MFEILTVCTGNICRSPLAELLLRERLADLPGQIRSAGTHGLDHAAMTAEAQRLATRNGVAPEAAAAHRSRPLDESMLGSPDLILVMARGHRRHVLELAPTRMRSTFTIREFARLAVGATDAEILAAADQAGSEASARLRAAAARVAARRGIATPPATPQSDDVVDPYRRSWQTYKLSAGQLVPAVDQVVRVVRLACSSG